MRKMRKKVMMLVLLSGLLLCSCGDSEKEEERTPQVRQKEERTEYLEQAVEGNEMEGMKSGMVNGVLVPNSVEKSRTPYQIVFERNSSPYLRKLKEDGSTEKLHSWAKNWKKKFKKKYLEVYSAEMLANEKLYLTVDEYSMDPGKYYDNEDKYKDLFYTTHRYLLGIDCESGEIREIPTPQDTYKERYKGRDMGDLNEKEVAPYDIRFFPDGNFLLTESATKFTIYNGITAEKMNDLDLSNEEANNQFLYALGDGFVALGVWDEATGKFRLHMYDEMTGTEDSCVEMDDMEIKTTEDGDEVACYAVAARENTIILVSNQCIYQMDYGDEKLEKVVDAKENNMFYLTDDDYFYEGASIGPEDDYYIFFMDESGEEKLCHYTKKGAKKK